MKRVVYHGDLTCTGREGECENGAYWYVHAVKQYLCGTHSKRYSETRKELPKRTKSQQAAFLKEKMNAHEATIAPRKYFVVNSAE